MIGKNVRCSKLHFVVVGYDILRCLKTYKIELKRPFSPFDGCTNEMKRLVLERSVVVVTERDGLCLIWKRGAVSMEGVAEEER